MRRAACLLLLAALASGEEKPAEPAVLTFRAADGLELEGAYYAPPRRGAPGILCFHGLGRDRGAWGALPARLQSEGYAVFAVTLRGHPEKKTRRAGGTTWLEMELPEFKAMASDVEAARACLAKQREVDALHIGLMGEEFGANLALAGGTDPSIRTAALLTPRLDARGISGAEAIAAFGERPCLAAASADDEQGAKALQDLKGAAKGKFEAVLLPADPSSGDFGAGMLQDEGKKGLADRLVAWFKETLPLPGKP